MPPKPVQQPGGKAPPPRRPVVINSISTTTSKDHTEFTSTTTFSNSGASITSIDRPLPPPPPAPSNRAGGSSGLSSAVADPVSKPPVVNGRTPVAAGGSGGGGAQGGSAAASAGPIKPVVVQIGKGKNAIIVNARQRGNPIISHIKNVAWEYGDIVPDYVVGQHTCILYLSLRYHRLHPEYLHQRIEKLAAMYQLRVLLVMCDVNDHQDPIREISKICIINNLTVMVCWTPEEAGLYLATYKIYEHKPPDILKERVHNDYRSYLNRSLTGIKGVNKTDVLTLSSSFGSFDRIIHASPEELSICPGVGETKVRRLIEAFSTPFTSSSSSWSRVTSTQGGVAKVVAAGSAGGEEVARGTVGEGKGRAMDGKGNPGAVEEEESAAERQFSPDWPDDDEEVEQGAEKHGSPDWEEIDKDEDGVVGGGDAKRKGKKMVDEDEEDEDPAEVAKKKKRKLVTDSP